MSEHRWGSHYRYAAVDAGTCEVCGYSASAREISADGLYGAPEIPACLVPWFDVRVQRLKRGHWYPESYDPCQSTPERPEGR